MDIVNIPEWIKKYGLVGFFVLIFIVISRFIASAILEQVVQDAWKGMDLKSILLIRVTIQIPLIVLIFIAFTTLILTIVWFILYKSRPKSKLRRQKLDMRKLPEAKTNNVDKLTRVDVITIIEAMRKGEKSEAEAANVIQNSINQKVIEPKLGAELANEFGYLVVLKPDGHYVVEKRV